MKLEIKKLPNANLLVVLTHNTGKTPIALELTPQQVDALVSMLTASKGATVFAFSLELP